MLPGCLHLVRDASERLKQQMIAVAALRGERVSRYCYSNYGEWVNASATGVRIRSMFVEGIEDPLDDPDLPT